MKLRKGFDLEAMMKERRLCFDMEQLLEVQNPGKSFAPSSMSWVLGNFLWITPCVTLTTHVVKSPDVQCWRRSAHSADSLHQREAKASLFFFCGFFDIFFEFFYHNKQRRPHLNLWFRWGWICKYKKYNKKYLFFLFGPMWTARFSVLCFNILL